MYMTFPRILFKIYPQKRKKKENRLKVRDGDARHRIAQKHEACDATRRGDMREADRGQGSASYLYTEWKTRFDSPPDERNMLDQENGTFS